MKLGDLQLDVVSDGTFALDGGAMFGVVPKVMWQKLMPADEYNRIKLGLNCLLIRGEKNVLIDTGVGNKFDSKFKERFAVNKTNNLVDGLTGHGLSVNDIDIVVLSHLHFDHAGGNTVVDNGKAVPTFPNAKYIIQKKEWEDATNPDERGKASYFPDNLLPVEKAGNLELIDGDKEVMPGVGIKVTGGHTAGHQIIMINSGGARGTSGVYFADLVPTTSHIKTPYVMGYDLFPLETIKVKKDLIHSAVNKNMLCFFEHDCRVPYGYLKENSGKIEVIYHG